MQKRFAGSEKTGRMHVKTGRLDGVAAVAGYVHARSGRQFVVVGVVNHKLAHRGPGQELLDAALGWTYEQ